jgi:hypothetical protein
MLFDRSALSEGDVNRDDRCSRFPMTAFVHPLGDDDSPFDIGRINA